MFHTNNPIIKHKAGLLNLAAELGNVSRACKVMGVSRDTFYRYQELVEEGGIDSLINRSRRTPNVKNRVDETIEQAVVAYAVAEPSHGQHRTSNELRKNGVFVSGSGVRSIWLRHNLENFKKRLKALEEKVAQEGIILNDAQIAALEKKQSDDEACGEIETAHPGYLGSQDTFYVGNLKGVGRLYQQTFVDTYSKVAFCKLYTTKTPITAADILNDKVLPFFEQHQLPMLRILTDRGTELRSPSAVRLTFNKSPSCAWLCSSCTYTLMIGSPTVHEKVSTHIYPSVYESNYRSPNCNRPAVSRANCPATRPEREPRCVANAQASILMVSVTATPY